ncbi:DUF4878 domain-containing protein [Hydrogenophaga sp. NFH-34]|uniref:DUF4878 domain-containing protein n=1 Tax=Hydrogenophaga sp. NFH-34 TaxID=2744446 RepID=UPI001F2CD6B9|nr:DUF4878 domain-containing protein [Hydrogenophaga sp. NFH-34]
MLRRQVALFLAVSATALLASCSGGSPENAPAAFYKASAAGEVDKAMEYVSFANFKAEEMVMAKGKVQMVVGRIQQTASSNDGLEKVEIIESVVGEDGNSAKVKTKLLFKNGKDKTDTVNVVKDDGKWKITLK